jgi:hypothetical protein
MKPHISPPIVEPPTPKLPIKVVDKELDYFVKLEIELYCESDTNWLAYVRNWRLLGEGKTAEEALLRAWKIVAYYGAAYNAAADTKKSE